MSNSQHRPRAKYHECGVAYSIVLRQVIGNAADSLARWSRFEICYRCNAPGDEFVRTEPHEGWLAVAPKPIVLDRKPS